MFGIGTTELCIIAFIALLIFGAGKLPSVMSSLAKGLHDFKKEIGGDDDIK